MKKAKFVLPVIGLLSVIAGAFAFKAQHRFTAKLVCYTNVRSSANLFLGQHYTAGSSFILKCVSAAAPNNAYTPTPVSPVIIE